MTNEWERVRQLADRQERGEGPGDDASERERHLYNLIEQLQSINRVPEQAVAALRKPAGAYRFYQQML